MPIYEVGTYEDQRYFSMKLVEGQGLDKKLNELAKDPRTAARVVAEVADAVNHAHQRGILHRDLKPANILVDAQGHAHVTDFGLAKRIEDDAGLTVSGAIMGTPSYMAPEQAAGQSSLVTTASDVYGLGAILYAALTGRAPFASDSVMNTLDQVRNSPPQPPTRLNPNLPRDLEVICLKCLEKDPRHRYASAQALSDDLNRWLRGEPISARPVGPVVRLRMWAKRKPALAGTLRRAHRRLDRRGDRRRPGSGARPFPSGTRPRSRATRPSARNRPRARPRPKPGSRATRPSPARRRLSPPAPRPSRTLRSPACRLHWRSIRSRTSSARCRKGSKGPGLYDLKAALLDSALKRIDGVAGIYEKSTSKEATTAAALMELGKIYRQLGQTQKAFQAYQKCLEITKERVKIKNYSDPSRQNLANTYFELAFCSEELNRDMKATLNYNQDGLKLYEDIYTKPKLDDFPLDRKVVRAGLAEAYTRVGVTQYRMGELTACAGELPQGLQSPPRTIV